MYTSFYNLLEKPFELGTDLRYLYLSAHHREALAHLTVLTAILLPLGLIASRFAIRRAKREPGVPIDVAG